MRDKTYITRILNELGRIWEAYPEQRLGELLLSHVDDELTLFYAEDDNLISMIKTNIYSNLLKEYKNGEAR